MEGRRQKVHQFQPSKFLGLRLLCLVPDWLQDKLVGSPFAMPAIYWPLSHIPQEHWRAAKYTSNGSEQKHHNLNIDGVGLTLLGGVNIGFQYNCREISMNFDLRSRYVESTITVHTTNTTR